MQSNLIFHYNLKFYESEGDTYDGVSLKRFVMQVRRFVTRARALLTGHLTTAFGCVRFQVRPGKHRVVPGARAQQRRVPVGHIRQFGDAQRVSDRGTDEI